MPAIQEEEMEGHLFQYQMGNKFLKNIEHCKKCGKFISRNNKNNHLCNKPKFCENCGQFIGKKEHKCPSKGFRKNIDLNMIKKLYVIKKKPIEIIAKLLNIDVSTVNSRLEYLKIKRERKKPNPNKIVKLYTNKNLPIKKISQVLNINEKTIKRILEGLRIKIRPSKFYQKNKKLSEENIKKVKEGIKKRREKLGYINSPQARRKLSKTRIERELSSMENNPMWAGGSSFEPYGIEFNKKLKKAIKERDGCCMFCNIGFDDLKLLKRRVHIHHVNYDKTCNLPQNLLTLCNPCHSKTNTNRKHWIKFFQSLLSERYSYQYNGKGEIVLELNLEKSKK